MSDASFACGACHGNPRQVSFLAQTLAPAITPALAGAVAILHSLRVVRGGYKRKHHKSIFGSAMVPSEPPTQAGNLNSMPEYALSMIGKVTILLGFGGDHVEAIKSANQLDQPLSGVSTNTKGVAYLIGDDASERCQNVGGVSLSFRIWQAGFPLVLSRAEPGSTSSDRTQDAVDGSADF